MSSNTPSDTPRTDAIAARIANPDDGFDSIGFCKQLERELAAARSDLECQGQAYSKALDDLAAANKRLEEARKHLVVISRDSVVGGGGDDGGFGCQDSKRPSDIALLAAQALAAIDGKEGKS